MPFGGTFFISKIPSSSFYLLNLTPAQQGNNSKKIFIFCGECQFWMHGHPQPDLAKCHPLKGAPAATPSSNQFSTTIQYLCSGLYHLPCKIELTAECHPTFCNGHNGGSWPFSAIFAIFAGFEGAMRSHGPADNQLT